MLYKVVRKLPTWFLNHLFDTLFFELQLRDEIVVPSENSVTEREYLHYRIRLISEQDNTYTTTWEVYEGDELICDGNDEFHSFEGEAEDSAIQWIQRCQNIREKCLPS